MLIMEYCLTIINTIYLFIYLFIYYTICLFMNIIV